MAEPVGKTPKDIPEGESPSTPPKAWVALAPLPRLAMDRTSEFRLSAARKALSEYLHADTCGVVLAYLGCMGPAAGAAEVASVFSLGLTSTPAALPIFESDISMVW